MTRSLADSFSLKTGKIIDTWEQYLGIYERELARFRAQGEPVDLLEIGVQNGGSLELWGAYLPTGSTIIGLDIDPKVGDLAFENEAIQAYVVDAAKPDAIREILGTRSFDVIIDDGSHVSSDIAATFMALFDRLKPGGVYIVEDLRRSYDPAHEGGVRQSRTSIEWLKRLVDAVNYDHVDAQRVDSEELSWLAETNRSVAVISFFDSVAVIEKFTVEKNRPFRRLLSGRESPVASTSGWTAGMPRSRLDTMPFGNAADRAPDADLVAPIEVARHERADAQVAGSSSARAALEDRVEAGRRAPAMAETKARATIEAAASEAAAREVELRAALTAALRQAEVREEAMTSLMDRGREDRDARAAAEGHLKTAEARASASAREAADLHATVRDELGRLTALSERGVALMEDNTAATASILSRCRDAGGARRAVTGRIVRLARGARLSTSVASQASSAVVGTEGTGAVGRLRSGFRRRLDPAQARRIASLFSPDWYIEKHPEVVASGLSPLEHYLRLGAQRGWDPHPLFASAWYLRRHPDVAAAGLIPIMHYVTHGFRDGRAPHPLFDAGWYRQSNPDLASEDIDLLAHYIAYGHREGRSPHPLFDVAFYLATNPDIREAGLEPLTHYLEFGGSEDRAPNAFFASRWYLDQNPDVAAAGINPLEHFIETGAYENRDPHPLFDLDAYPSPANGRPPWDSLAHHLNVTLPATVEAVATSGMFDSEWYARQLSDEAFGGDLIAHYLKIGSSSGLSPHPLFVARWYLTRYPDLAVADPFGHYVTYGAAEGRQPGPLVDVPWFASRRGHAEDAALDPLAFFLRHGAGTARSTTSLFDPDWYRSHHLDVTTSDIAALTHYATIGMAAGLRPNAAFDPSWYEAHHAALMVPGLSAFEHFTATGSHQRLNPGPFFDARFYLQRHSDVAGSGVEPLSHYLGSGRAEGRLAFPRGTSQKIAVILHFYYLDLLPQIKAHLKAIAGPYDLYVTHPENLDLKIVKQLRRLGPRTTLIPVPDIGFDIAPFFVALKAIKRQKEQYLCICKIHTKKGRTDPAVWRHLLLSSVLGGRALVDDIIRGFAEDPSLALVGARKLYLDGETFSRDNRDIVGRLQADLYPGAEHTTRWGFLAGTMFWFRPQVFDRLADLLERNYRFEATASNDGQIPHGIERMFGFIIAMEHKRVGLLDVSADGHLRWDYEVQEAGRSTSEEPLHLYLKRISETLQPHLPAAGSVKSHTGRHWRPSPGRPFGVRLVAPIRAINGIAVSARGYLRAIEAAECRVSVCDWTMGFERLKLMDVDLPSDGDEPIQITHLNLDLLEQISSFHPSEFDDLVRRSRYNILVPYFELVSLKPAWFDVLGRFDEVWCASTFLERALNAASPVLTRVLRPTILPDTATSGAFGRAHFGLPRDRFVFGYVADAGSVLGRKNPLALVEAYVAEFKEADGTCCFIKVHYGRADDPTIARIAEIAGRRRDVIFSDAVYSSSEMEALIGSLDCYVSPHRSEGLGLTIVEAMNAGVPVIATNYGGAIDMLDPGASVPLSYRLIEVGAGNAPYPASYTWADPEPAALRAALRSLADDRDRARSIGAAGRVHVGRLFGIEATAPAVRAALDDIWRTATAVTPARGE